MDDLIDLNYSVNTLICINSAKHGYSEIPLDQHMVMYGSNNKGKTVTLSMMKLLLFPDTNFKDCKNKFAFRSKDGSYYNSADSHRYYFPSDQSYIILEGENPEGVYCMILFRNRGQDWGFGRLFVATDYASIRHLFWQSDAATFAENLSFNHIKRGVKPYKHLQLSDSNDLAQMMYGGHASADPLIRKFSVFPLLGEASNESIEAFRRVYQLAFDTSDNQGKTLPMALATLIEMQRSRPEERLDANLLHMAEEYERLLEHGKWLQRVKNCIPTWNNCWSAFEQVQSDFITYSRQHYQLDRSVAKQRGSLTHDKQEALEQFQEVAKQLNTVKQQGKALEQQILRSEGGRERLQSGIKKQQADLNKAKQLVSSYANMSETEVIEILREELDAAENKVREYQDVPSLQTRFTKLQNDIKSLRSERERIQTALAEQIPTIAEQITDHADDMSKFAAVNAQLASATIRLSEPTRTTLTAFLGLFDVSATQKLMLEQQELTQIALSSYDPSQIRKQQQQRLEVIAEQLQDKEAESREIAELLKQKDLSVSLEKVTKERDQTKQELALVQGLTTFQAQLTEAEGELAIALEREQELATQVQQLKEQMTPLQQDYHQREQQYAKLNQLDEQLSHYRTRLKRMSESVFPLAVSDIAASDDEQQALELNDSTLVELECLLQRINAKFTELKHHFELVLRDLQPPDIDPHVLRTRVEEFSGPIESLHHHFSTFEYDYDQHLKSIRTHNQYVNNQLRELEDAKTQIQNTIASINKELNRKTISNLSEIRLELTLHPTFLNLLDKLSSHSIEDTTLLDASFYQEIRNFAEKHFHKRSRQLKLKDIIEKVDYSYLHANSSKRVTEGQSGGTTSTVTAFVLSVLLKQIVKRNCSMRLPIVVDEIGTLDKRNTEAVVSQIIEHGFTLFCATPNYSPVLNLTIGRTLDLDVAKVPEVRVDKCVMHVLPAHINTFGKRADEA